MKEPEMIFAKRALLGTTWVANLRIAIKNGTISNLERGAVPNTNDICVDTLLPAPANLHSHAFQRAMAGMTEFRISDRESFWTWRDLMYRFLDRLNPEQMEAVAALAFMEMQEAGYASVGEFHYVHHQPKGRTYDHLSELAQRIIAAATETGIGLTLLPVLYSYGGVNQMPPTGGQLRFVNDLDRYLRLVEECENEIGASGTDGRVGIAPHSLRATTPSDLNSLLSARPEGPVHIHIAEQLKEVADVKAGLGQTPVAWLLENTEVNERWCLIHATHMTDAETRALACSGAVAGLCPITESNLGDGIFNGSIFQKAGGTFGIGSDSNVRISLTEELRTLEYSQRLRDMERNVLAGDGLKGGSTGWVLYLGAVKGGAQALARDTGEIALGKLADLIAIDSAAPALCALREDRLLDGFCFAASDAVVTDTWSAGRHIVQNGQHKARDAILARYRNKVLELIDAL